MVIYDLMLASNTLQSNGTPSFMKGNSSSFWAESHRWPSAVFKSELRSPLKVDPLCTWNSIRYLDC